MTATATALADTLTNIFSDHPAYHHHAFLLPRSSAGNSTAIQATARTESTATFLTAFWLNAAIFGGELLAFSLLRPAFKSVYEMRTYDPKVDGDGFQRLKRARTFLEVVSWIPELIRADYNQVLETNGMDAYFFVRYLRMMIKLFGPIWLISWITLLPLTGITGTTGKTGLDRFTFGNIGASDDGRYWGLLVVAWVFTIWIWWMIHAEMRHFVIKRQQHLVDPAHSSTAQANTIMITGIPPKYITRKALTELFAPLPSGVRKVWLNRDLKQLPDIYDARLKACKMLESAETQLIATAVKMKAKKSQTKDKKEKPRASTSTAGEPLTQVASTQTDADLERGGEDGAALLNSVPKDKRPTHRLPVGPLPFSLPFIGKKVDTIDWAREEILNNTLLLEKGRRVLRLDLDKRTLRSTRATGIAGVIDRARNMIPGSETETEPLERKPSRKEEKERLKKMNDLELKAHEIVTDTYPPLSSAFVLFNQQLAAHLAVQALTHHQAYRMSSKYIEVAPGDVIWGNLGLNPYERRIRTMISYAITVGLIVLWSFPVAFVGAVSNVSTLCTTYSWLAWLCRLPKPVIGIIEGVLPQALLATLMLLLPVFLRLLGRFEGIPRRSGLELTLMTRYFCFQVINSFLIVTISSGIIAALPGLLENPSSIPGLLATALPEASNFFLSYIILQGLSGSASGFLQIAMLVLYYLKLFVLGSTPRQVANIKYTPRRIQLGTVFPATTLLTVISIAYMIISPIINGLACITFVLFFQMYKYLYIHQLEQKPELDTGGMFFPLAMQHVFVGLYIQQICLASLFFLSRGASGEANCITEGALTIVMLFSTAFFHMIVNNSYGPLLNALPLTLADRSYSAGAGMNNDSKPVPDAAADPQGAADAVPSASTPLIGDAEKGQGSFVAPPADEKHVHIAGAGVSSATDDKDSRKARRRSAFSALHSRRASEQGVLDGIMHSGERKDRSALLDARGTAPGSLDDKVPTDFSHPATYEPLQEIWLPADGFGCGDNERHVNVMQGIASVCDARAAVMDEKGRVKAFVRMPESFEKDEDKGIVNGAVVDGV